jgi:pyrimidine operon attenuation protein/uracil phosphoribosyltransferase
VALAVLIDRGGRELPIAADVAGTTLDLPTEHHVKLSGPEPLALAYVERGDGRKEAE